MDSDVRLGMLPSIRPFYLFVLSIIFVQFQYVQSSSKSKESTDICGNMCAVESECCPTIRKCCSKEKYLEEIRELRSRDASILSVSVESIFDYRLLFLGIILLCLPVVFCCLDLLYNCLCTLPIERNTNEQSFTSSDASAQTVSDQGKVM